MNQFGSLRRNTPVCIFISLYESRLYALIVPDMRHPSIHVRIIMLYGPAVTILLIEHIGSGDEYGRPCDIVAIVVPVGRSHIRNNTVSPLCLADILQPLIVKRLIIEKETLSPASHGAIAEPRHSLIALRAVDRHSLIVVEYAPVGILYKGVDDIVVAGEGSVSRHGIGNN